VLYVHCLEKMVQDILHNNYIITLLGSSYSMSSEQHDRVVMLTFLSVLLVPFTFTNPQIVPNLNEFVYFAEQKKRYFE